MDIVRTSKFLSLILRHQPESVGLKLDANGWVEIEDLLNALNSHGHTLGRAQLEKVVLTSSKKRFIIEADRIRANQGHSLEVDLNLRVVEPPAELFHGTSAHFLSLILEQGLKKMNRQHVHLSVDRDSAEKVGRRHGEPVVLRVDSGGMFSAGVVFHLSENGVWLVDQVPAEYLQVVTRL